MFTWLLGRENSKDDDENDGYDEDELCSKVLDTPAPIFVARAFKSALFGTPTAPQPDEVELKREDESLTKNLIQSHSENQLLKNRPGILLTPGNATITKKTVSFHNDTVEIGVRNKADRESKESKQRHAVDLDFQDINSGLTNRKVRKTPLTLRFENAKMQKSGDESTNIHLNLDEEKCLLINSSEKVDKNDFNLQSEPTGSDDDGRNLRDVNEDTQMENHDDGDATVDLNKPHSQSGKYWKSEFENYHREARLEMRKLLSYKEIAKSFAKIKDEYSINLVEKLKEEQRKVIAMEETISRLSTKIRVTDKDGVEDVDERRILVKELARQTARAVQYKEQVEEFRKLMENIEPNNSIIERGGKVHRSLPVIENQIDLGKTILTSQLKRDVKQLTLKLQEVTFLKAENRNLRQIMRDKDKSIDSLKFERKELTGEIRQLKAQLVKLEERLVNDNLLRVEKTSRFRKSLLKSELSLEELKDGVELQKDQGGFFQSYSHHHTIGEKNEILTTKNVKRSTRLQNPLSIDYHDGFDLPTNNQEDFELLDTSLQQKNLNKTRGSNLKEPPDKILVLNTQTTTLSSTKNSQESQLAILHPSTSDLDNCSRSQVVNPESWNHLPSPQSLHVEEDRIIKNIGTQDISENKMNEPNNTRVADTILNTQPSRYFKTLSPSQNIESKLSNLKIHDEKISEDHMNQIYSDAWKQIKFQEKSIEDNDFSISAPTRLRYITKRPKRNSLPPERFEAAKRRLAEKKRSSVALTELSRFK